LDQLWSGASGGGGEATGQRNLDGVARLGEIPAGSGGGGSVSRGGRRGHCCWKKRGMWPVCSVTSSQKRGRRVEKGRATAGLRIAAARWRPASTRGHRGAQRRGQRGEAIAAARGRATRGEGQQ
jgi:hypothetical protein